MRRKKSRLQSQTVSLFPFLAVLICTFGVLIILLVIVVKAADVQAENVRQQQEQNHQKQIATIQDDLELQKIRVEGIRSIRPELVNKLKAEKTQRAHIQADIERLTQQMKLVAKTLCSN